MWSKARNSCRFSFAMLSNFGNCCFASPANPSEIWSMEARFSDKCLYRISLILGLLTNRFGVKHLQFSVRGNFISDLSAIWEQTWTENWKCRFTLSPSEDTWRNKTNSMTSELKVIFGIFLQLTFFTLKENLKKIEKNTFYWS